MHSKYDRDGKLMVQFHELRGAVVSANVTLSTGTTTSLIAGDSDKMLDIVEISFANDSTAATTVTLSNDGTTVRTVNVPTSGTVQLYFDVPLEQITKNTPWLIDMPDITGTNIYVGASLIKRHK